MANPCCEAKSAGTPVVRIALIRVPHPGAERAVTRAPCEFGRFSLCSEWTAERLAARKFQNVVDDRGPLRTTLRSRFHIDVRHLALRRTHVSDTSVSVTTVSGIPGVIAEVSTSRRRWRVRSRPLVRTCSSYTGFPLTLAGRCSRTVTVGLPTSIPTDCKSVAGETRITHRIT